MFAQIDGSKPGIHYITYPEVQPNSYLITDQGVIIDLIQERIVRYTLDKDGYVRVNLRSTKQPKHGKTKYIKLGVHRLVAWEFCENDDPITKNIVNHLDTKIMHNDRKNLEWTTVAGNTEHAVRTGVRNVDGGHNGRALLSEDLVHKICAMYQDGLEPIDVYHALYSDGPLRNSADTAFYSVLYDIKIGKRWTKISSEYSFDHEIKKDPSKKIFQPKPTSRFNEEQVHWVCKQIQDGCGIQDVVKLVKSGKMPGYEPRFGDPEMELKSLNDGIGRIARGRVWKHITKMYDFSKRAYAANPNHTYMNETFQTLIDSGMTKPTIIKTVMNQFQRSEEYVRFKLNTYLREHGYEVVYGGFKKEQ